jgi:hypothetical protein
MRRHLASPRATRSPARAFHAERLDGLGNQIINSRKLSESTALPSTITERRQSKVGFTCRLPTKSRSEAMR